MPKKARILLFRTVKKILQKFDIAPVIHYFIYGRVSPEWPAAPPFSLNISSTFSDLSHVVPLFGVGVRRYKPYEFGGHPAPAGRALPNLINAVKMLKSKSKPRCGVDFDVDFNILTAFIRLDRAGPEGAGCPPYL